MDTNHNRRNFLRNAGLLGLAGVAGSKVTTALAAEVAPKTITCLSIMANGRLCNTHRNDR